MSRIYQIRWIRRWCSIFLPNLVKKVNIAYSTCNLVLNSLNYTQLYRYVYFFCFQLEKPFFVKFGPRKENYLFKMKFDIKTNSNMLNQILMFIFSILYWKYFFSGKYNPKHFLGTSVLSRLATREITRTKSLLY